MVTSHAGPVPNTRHSALTPASRSSVSARAPGSTVRARCGHTPAADGASDRATIVTSGSTITAAIAADGEAPRRGRLRRARAGQPQARHL